ncbi:MAG: signal peptidase I [Candidatus Nomurabacteria bacterium]|nr:signal peptidase I [Candidatus Nomurabacteria bacterium]
MSKGGTSKVNLVKVTLLLLLALFVVTICTFVYKVFHPSSLWYLGFLAACLVVTWLVVGFRLRRSVDGGQATQIVVVYILLYMVLIYLLGLITGFLRNGYSLEPLMIVYNVLPVAGVTLLTELWRYALVKRIGNHKMTLVGVMLAFSVLTILVGLQTYRLGAPLEIFEMVGRLVLGGIAMNVMLTFVSYKSDWRPAVTYALIMAIYPIVAPIIPDLGPFIYSILAILLPTLLLMRFNEFFVTKRPIPGRHKRSGQILATAPIMVGLVVVVVLVSGVFRYWAMAIGSDSMRPGINTGDVVIIDKTYGAARDIQLGSVVAFRHDGKIVTHRLVETKNSVSGLQIQTKGDNNSANDAWVVREDDLVGVVRWKIPLIGWPTIWLDRAL